MNSQIMENVIQYYLHVYDSALRIYSQKKSEYRTANYLYCGYLYHEFSFLFGVLLILAFMRSGSSQQLQWDAERVIIISYHRVSIYIYICIYIYIYIHKKIGTYSEK